MRIGDWSADVCSSDLGQAGGGQAIQQVAPLIEPVGDIGVDAVMAVGASLDADFMQRDVQRALADHVHHVTGRPLPVEPRGRDDRERVVEGNGESVRVYVGGVGVLNNNIHIK